MFENLLFQQQIVSTLTNEINAKTLPQSLLFYGDEFSGKLTAALELARVLNCEFDGTWGCKCKSCNQNLTLQHPYTLLTGSRYSMQEISQSGEFLIKEQSISSQFMFTRNVRKLIKRFNEDLWDREDNKYKKAITALNKIEEVIYLVDPTQKLPTEKKLISSIKKITAECQKLSNELPKGNIPISQIRKLSSWVRRSANGSKKVVILERAELMLDSSRNALLKILEEPPADTYFILISEKKSTVLPTILSRVRAYGFRERNIEEQTLILNKLFKHDNISLTIKDYFFSFSNYSGDSFNIMVETYLNSSFDDKSSFNDALETKIETEYFNKFLEVFTNKLRDIFYTENQQRLSLSQLESINKYIKDKIIKQVHFNQSPMLLLETLFYEIKGIFNA
ncbi:MAG: hypothetical protein OCD02_10580 [Spirochaetaceae bacterium]